ncbi:MAG TPA: thioredoxin [Chloroflexi bacterium]|nr:thioredoxin [Chloroflexota bacterium]
MRLLVRIFNHRSFPLIAALALIVAALIAGRDGFSGADALILLVVAAAAVLVWRMLVTHQTESMDSLEAVREALHNGQRATVLEFFSTTCAGCLAMKPVVDRLEAEAGERLQIIRLNIDEEPGRTLMEEYGVIFTPTFIYFDPDGNKLRESIGVLDQARILFDLERT